MDAVDGPAGPKQEAAAPIYQEEIMLCLSRKRGEKIHIGPDITITVIGVYGGIVRLGIEAPREVPIVRDNAIQKGPDDAAA
jgi:carbon storage regulator